MRRKWKLVAVIVLTGLILTFVLPAWLRGPQINKDSFDQIKRGMTRQEVEAILKRPPGDYTDRRVNRIADYAVCGAEIPEWSYREWIGDDGIIILAFDEEGRVGYTQFIAVDHWPERTYRERLRAWIRRVVPGLGLL
jgi:hypothetical protein